jgi:hypothetical protein
MSAYPLDSISSRTVLEVRSWAFISGKGFIRLSSIGFATFGLSVRKVR